MNTRNSNPYSNNKYCFYSSQNISKHYHTIIIGGGPSGLVMSRLLMKAGISSHCIFEKDRFPGSSWHRLPDDFILAMPVKDIDLPEADLSHFEKDHYLTRDEVIFLLEQYVTQHCLPIQYNTAITSIRHNQEKTIFYLSTSQGIYSANNVIVCTGPRQAPRYPSFALKIKSEVRMHSADYHNPYFFPVNLPVLVIGSGLSALTIAYQLKKSGYHVILACGYNDAQVKKNNKHLFFTDDGRENENISSDIFLPSQLEKIGVINYGKLMNVTEDGYLHFNNKQISYDHFGKIIFATGYTQNFPFLKNLYDIKTNQIFHAEGVVFDIPGLYFVGIPPVYTENRQAEAIIINQGSRDARRIAKLIETNTLNKSAVFEKRSKL